MGTQQSNELTLDEFRIKLRESQPVCKECGFTSHSLVAHLLAKHKMSGGQYKKKYPDAELASPLNLELLRCLGHNPIRAPTSLSELSKVLGKKHSQNDDFIKTWKPLLTRFEATDSTREFVPVLNKKFLFTKNAPFIAMSLLKKKNLMVSGTPGCGKTEEIKQVFAALGMPIRRANMHGDVTYNTFIGSIKANANGTYFEYGLLPQAMKAGYPVLLDEIDFTPPNISAVLFPVLEKDSELYIPETGEHIKPSPGFNVFATGNTGGKGDSVGVFTGTEVLNTAFLDRFSIKLNASYLPSVQEVALLCSVYPEIRKEFFVKAVAFATEVRAGFLQGDLNFTWSTRKLLEFGELLTYLPLGDALDVTLYNWLDNDDMGFVKQLMQRTGLDKQAVL